MNMKAGQSRLHSIIEAVVNVVIGLITSFLANLVVLPMFGVHLSMGDYALMTVIFTVISIVRSYCLRRWFNAWMVRQVARL